MLTGKQQKFYEYLQKAYISNWWPPTYTKMVNEYWLSKRAIVQYLEALQKKWYLTFWWRRSLKLSYIEDTNLVYVPIKWVVRDIC